MGVTKPSYPWYRTSRRAWYVESDGKQVCLAKGDKADTRAEAMQAFHRLMADEPQPGGRAADLTAAVVCDRFLTAAERRFAADTFVWYKRYLQSFVAFRRTGLVPVSRLTEDHATAWLDAQPGWGRSSRRAAVTCVKQAFAWAERKGHTRADPLRHLSKPGAVARRRTLTPAERALVAGAVRDQGFRDFVFALEETGCRPSEAARVTAADADLASGVWTLAVHKTAKATGRPRVVYLTPAMVELTRRLAAARPDGPLFRGRGGRPFTRNAVRTRFRRLRAKFPQLAGVTAYAYRHTFATDALENGVGVAQVAELLGHTGTEMVMRHYSKLSQRVQHLRDMAAKAAGGPTADVTPRG